MTRGWTTILPPRRRLAIACALAAALLLALAPGAARPASADLGGFVITDFHTDLTVEEDADLVVEETIQVDFSAPRRGIYRTIPVTYTDPRGFTYGLRFQLLGVEDEQGDSHPTKVSRDGPNVKIRIGDEDVTVTGPMTYVIRYRVEGALQQLDSHDELYWNAVGDEWATTIESASAVVHLPGGLEASDAEASAFSGLFGTVDGGVSIQEESGGQLRYETDGSLEPYEALTVVAAWPQGYVDFPSQAEIWLDRLLRNWVILLPFVAGIWTFVRYRRVGRDPEGGGSITVQYEPPPGVGPAEVGTIVDEKVDMRDITAVLVNLAVRGLLRIEVSEKEGLIRSSEQISFTRLAPAGDAAVGALLPHERAVFDGIFQHGDTVSSEDLEEEFYKEIPGIEGALYGRLVDEGYFEEDPNHVRISFIGKALLWVLVVFGLGVLTAWLVGAIFPAAFIVPAIAALLTALFTMPFARAMPRRTEKGVRLREWALGFEEFVNRVESDRLERTEAITAFETLLPYAMALGVSATWARKFEDIYEEGRSPGWYVGPHRGMLFSTIAFESSLRSSMSSVGSSMASQPRSSSSSGGGGFSGGGFGGGGGGSW